MNTLEHLDENHASVVVRLTPDDLREIDAAAAKIPTGRVPGAAT